MLQGKRVVITGGEGFVGTHLRSRLKEDGAEVILMDLSMGIDITDWEQLKEYGQDIDTIYHLAARTYIPSTNNDPRGTYMVNLTGTLNMLELGRVAGIRKFVYASAYVYGPPKYLPIDENHPLFPVNPYNRSKALGEQLCQAYCQDHGVECTILRAFNIYGEGQRDDFLIPSIFKQLEQQEIELKDPNPKRDFVNISDVVEAYIKAAQYSATNFRIFNIGSGVSYSVDEIARMVIAASGQSIKVKYLNQCRENEIGDTVADISKAKRELDWTPLINLSEGIKRYAEWFSAKRIQ